MRGKVTLQDVPCDSVGITPRVCGEKVWQTACEVVVKGSPPAYAGKRVRCSQQALPCTDHPRMCGEKRQDRLDYYVPQGSPPHVRGKGGDGNDRGLHARITPACAGKSQCACTRARSARDHPRMCGEKQSNSRIRMIQKGSPPHVRGKVLSVNFFGGHFGITPACAGKRRFIRACNVVYRDHPRMCGEKPALILRITRPQGSPPHVRGKEHMSSTASQRAGITPACAGKRKWHLG